MSVHHVLLHQISLFYVNDHQHHQIHVAMKNVRKQKDLVFFIDWFFFVGYVYLDRPPAPPRQVIRHSCELPVKPRDIIIERWCPSKSAPTKLIVQSAPPFNHEPLHNINIIHEAPEPRINHRIAREPPTLANPETYRRLHGHTLLHEEALKRRLLEELRDQHATEDIVSYSVI